MSKAISSKISPVRIGLIALVIFCLGLFVQWDKHRLNTDFDKIISLLKNVQRDAGVNNKQLIVKFKQNNIIATDGKSGQLFTTLNVPTLHSVDYNTTLGNNMIVFDGVGTSAYNKKIHGGDLTLRSWFGFKKYIAVNCNGLPREGRYPD